MCGAGFAVVFFGKGVGVGRAYFCRKPTPHPRALLPIADRTSRSMGPTPRGLCPESRNMQGSSRAWKGDNVQVFCRLFHVEYSSARPDTMFRPNRFSIAQFCLHVCLNLKPCAKTEKLFQHPVRASCAQCAPETLPEAEELAPSMAQATRTEIARGPWDALSIPTDGTSCRLMLYGQGPRRGTEFAKQHSSAMSWCPPHRRSRACRCPRRTLNPKRVAFHTLFPFGKG